MSTALYDVANVLPSLLSDSEVMNGMGSIAFTQTDGNIGRIFLKQGNIYAVDNLNYEHNLWVQLKFEEYLNHGNLRSLIRSNKSQRDSLYKLLRKTRQKNDAAVAVLKEHLLGSLDDIYQWKQVQVEWRAGEQFEYESASIPDLPLSRLITITVNRANYKYEKYQDWGFKDDSQFLYGNLSVDLGSSKKTSYPPKTRLEDLIVTVNKFIIKGIQDGTGYSLFSIINTIDDLADNYEIMIENPSGRQAATIPVIPPGIGVIKEKVNFSAIDEDIDMQERFNTEYKVPEPARLETQETFATKSPVLVDENSEEMQSYDDIINDTSSLEIQQVLPPLEKPELASLAVRQEIPESELLKEYEAQQEIADLYTPSKEASKEPNENPVELTKESKTMSLPTNPTSDLLGLVRQLQDGLEAKKQTIDSINSSVQEKEQQLKDARNVVTKVEDELGRLLLERETTTSDYDQALSVITNLK